MVKLTGTFSKLEPVHVMVIGDLILDTYTIGQVERISPEAPVGVVHVEREEFRPGGAGNVALNLLSLGAPVSFIGRIGDTKHGEVLLDALKIEGVDVSGVVVQPKYQTPVKNRIIAENQQIVRVDHEEIQPVSKELEEQILQELPRRLKNVSAVAISDYGKGTLTEGLLAGIIAEARKAGVPVIVDPKGADFTRYHGATVLKPNLREVYKAAGLDSTASLSEAAHLILKQTDVYVLMVTRGSQGISLFYQDGTRQDYKPLKSHEVKDVTGAGDTVLAMITCAMANKLELSEAAQLANVAAGIAIEHFGCARVTLAELAVSLLEVSVENKIFDEEHLFTLKQALNGSPFAVVGINSNPGLTPKLFASLQKLSQKQKVLIYLRDKNPEQDFVNMLASICDIDFIIRKKDSLRNLCRMIEPSQVFTAQINGIELIENIDDLIGAR